MRTELTHAYDLNADGYNTYYAICGRAGGKEGDPPSCPDCLLELERRDLNASWLDEPPVNVGPPVRSTFGDRDVTGGRERRR